MALPDISDVPPGESNTTSICRRELTALPSNTPGRKWVWKKTCSDCCSTSSGSVDESTRTRITRPSRFTNRLKAARPDFRGSLISGCGSATTSVGAGRKISRRASMNSSVAVPFFDNALSTGTSTGAVIRTSGFVVGTGSGGDNGPSEGANRGAASGSDIK